MYTIGYANVSAEPLYILRIYDTTPAYTVFVAASCGPLPADLSACDLNVAPSVGSSGPLEWGFLGSLAPGASGTVTFSVLVD